MTHYFIIGADGREYGPASEEDIRLWVRERRAGGRTQVRREGESVWRPLSELSELADILDPDSSDQKSEGSVPPPMPGEGEEVAREVFRRDPVLNIGEAFARGWDLLVEHWLVVGVATALGGLILFGVGSIPVVGVAAAFCMLFMVLGGVELAILKLLRGEPVDIGMAFVGFSPPLVLPLFLSGVVASVLVTLGLLLCILPGVYLAVCWLLYTPLLIADRRLDFWQALECGRRVVTRYWWPNLGLFLLGHLVVAAGLLACGVGVLISLPLALAAMVVAYEETFGSLGDEAAEVEGGRSSGDGGSGVSDVPGVGPVEAESIQGSGELVVADGVGPMEEVDPVEKVEGSQVLEESMPAAVPPMPTKPKKRAAAAGMKKRASAGDRRSKKKEKSDGSKRPIRRSKANPAEGEAGRD